MNSSSSELAEPGASVLFLIRSLLPGGAERQLVYLALGLHSRGYRVTVATYYPGAGALSNELEQAGVRLINLGKRGRWDLAGFFLRLVRTIRQYRPDVLYSFLGTSNVLAVLARPFVQPFRIVWSVRASDMEVNVYGWMSVASYKVECALSRRADLIISNSQAGFDHAAAQGFPPERMIVIPNGIDTELFKPDAAAREAWRSRWGIGPDEVVVGLLARLDPVKDHPTFVRAASRAARSEPRLRFVCVGFAPDEYRAELERLAEELGIASQLLFTGSEDSPAAALNGFDICCSSSTSEGFSNSVAEAMACGVPCVVTDVGDSAVVVGDMGTVVPPRDPEALGAALAEMAALKRSGRAPEPRARVLAHFSTAAMISSTEKALGLTNAPHDEASHHSRGREVPHASQA